MIPASLGNSQSSLSETKDLNASSFVGSCDVSRFLFSQINELLSFEVISTIDFLRVPLTGTSNNIAGLQVKKIVSVGQRKTAGLLKQTKY